MSDENKTVPAKDENPHVFDVEANGIRVPIHEFTITKGRKENQGNTYFAPLFDKIKLPEVVLLHGEDNVFDAFLSKYRQLCQGITKVARKIGGSDSEETKTQWIKLFLELSPSGESKRELNARLMDLYARLGNLNPATAASPQAFMDEFTALKTKIEKLNEQLKDAEDDASADPGSDEKPEAVTA